MFSETGVGAVQGANGQLYDSPGSLWLTNTITSIGSYAFSDCDNDIRIIVRKRVYDRFMSDESDTFGWKDYKDLIQTESNLE